MQQPREVRLATWAEIDTAGRVWTVPATRMKAKREHRVPLSQRAVEILEAARTLGGSSDFAFPMRSGRPIGMSTLPKMLQQHRIPAVPHGFRSSFRDWAAEKTDHPREVIGGGAGARGPEQGRSRLRPFGPVRAAAAAHGRLGLIPRTATREGCPTPVTPPGHDPIQWMVSLS